MKSNRWAMTHEDGAVEGASCRRDNKYYQNDQVRDERVQLYVSEKLSHPATMDKL